MTLSYLDNIVTFSSTIEKHLKHLEILIRFKSPESVRTVSCKVVSLAEHDNDCIYKLKSFFGLYWVLLPVKNVRPVWA